MTKTKTITIEVTAEEAAEIFTAMSQRINSELTDPNNKPARQRQKEKTVGILRNLRNRWPQA